MRTYSLAAMAASILVVGLVSACGKKAPPPAAANPLAGTWSTGCVSLGQRPARFRGAATSAIYAFTFNAEPGSGSIDYREFDSSDCSAPDNSSARSAKFNYTLGAVVKTPVGISAQPIDFTMPLDLIDAQMSFDLIERLDAAGGSPARLRMGLVEVGSGASPETRPEEIDPTLVYKLSP